MFWWERSYNVIDGSIQNQNSPKYSEPIKITKTKIYTFNGATTLVDGKRGSGGFMKSEKGRHHRRSNLQNILKIL